MKFWGRTDQRQKSVEEPISPPKVRLRESMMDPKLAKLYAALTEATRGDANVLPGIRLSHFLKVAPQDIGDAILMDRKCVDFLVCEPITMRPLAVVQFLGKDQEAADRFISHALVAAGILVLQIREREDYLVANLREQLIPRLLATESQGRAGRQIKNHDLHRQTAIPR